MRQEHTDKMNSYLQREYQELLKGKNVLDSWQFLHSSYLYLNYAVISEQMYRDVVKQNFSQNGGNPFDCTVTVLGFPYDVYKLLNKLTLEWVSHVSNAIDMLLQYINSALHLRLAYADVKTSNVSNSIKQDYPAHQMLLDAFKSLVQDDGVEYIRAVYNYSKHTLNLYGGSDFFEALNGNRYINILDFRYHGKEYPSRCISTLFESYESFIEKYLAVLDSIDNLLNNTPPVPNRYHIGNVVVNGNNDKSVDSPLGSDISLYYEINPSSGIVKRVWIEDIPLSAGDHIEVFPANRKRFGQNMKYIERIAVYKNGEKIGVLKLGSADIRSRQKRKTNEKKEKALFETSAHSYHRYTFSPISCNGITYRP